jgi:hypothetical protein
MKPFLQTLGMLLGLLLCVCGAAIVLITGLDVLYGCLGVALALSGGAVLWVIHRRGPSPGTQLPGSPQRSRQLPLAEQHRDTRLRGRPDQRI